MLVVVVERVEKGQLREVGHPVAGLAVEAYRSLLEGFVPEP